MERHPRSESFACRSKKKSDRFWQNIFLLSEGIDARSIQDQDIPHLSATLINNLSGTVVSLFVFLSDLVNLLDEVKYVQPSEKAWIGLNSDRVPRNRRDVDPRPMATTF
jgi:hypothetical protein